MHQKILTAFEQYANDDHDLAVSLVARELGIDEAEVRLVVE